MGSSRSQTLGRCPGVRPSRGGTNLGHCFHADRCGVDAGDSEYLTRGDYLRPVESAGSGQIDLRIGALGCQSSVLPFKALSCNTYRVYKERQSRQRRRGTESPLAGWYKAGHPDRCSRAMYAVFNESARAKWNQGHTMQPLPSASGGREITMKILGL